MRKISLLAAAATVLMIGTSAFSKPRKPEVTIIFESTKIIPEGASLEYRVNGQLAQVLTIPAGRYNILISQLK